MTEPTPPPADDSRASVPRFILRTALLILSAILLFPMLLDRFTQGGWSRFVQLLGDWRWVAWGACFVGMVLLRFAGGPKRGG